MMRQGETAFKDERMVSPSFIFRDLLKMKSEKGGTYTWNGKRRFMTHM